MATKKTTKMTPAAAAKKRSQMEQKYQTWATPEQYETIQVKLRGVDPSKAQKGRLEEERRRKSQGPLSRPSAKRESDEKYRMRTGKLIRGKNDR